MSRAADIIGLFSLRRISGQIAAAILVSLVLIHMLIAGYFLLNRPEPFAGQPLERVELLARLIADASRSERGAIVDAIHRSIPELQLQLHDAGALPAGLARDASRLPIPLHDDRFELIRGASAEDDRILYHLADGAVVEARIGPPKLPGFVSGLWTSTLLFLLTSVTLLGIWAGRALSSPLSAFARAAESFSLSGSSAALPETGPEEIKSTARALNRMRDRISSLMNDRTRMLAAISHDLRTPITRLRLRTEFIEDEAQRGQTMRDLDQMQAMLEQVLTLLRSESAVKPTLVDVAALLQMVCEQFADGGHVVGYRGPDRATLTIRPDDLGRAVTNLVENAVRFGTEVNVELSVTGDQVIIDINDNGPGIPEDQKSAMLEPFVRGQDARTMDETSGFGLGLSIANGVVQAHGGRLSLHDNDPHGLRARISLPKGVAAAA